MRLYISLFTLILLLPNFLKAQIDSSLLFEKSKKVLLHPLANFIRIANYRDSANYSIGGHVDYGITYYTDNEDSVKAIFDGTVVHIFKVENEFGLMTKFGKYFITYFGLSKPVVEKGDFVLKSQYISKLFVNESEGCKLELFISTRNGDLDPAKWLK